MPQFYEFFAGGGMVRAGLGPGWRCAFANDVDAKKAETYRDNWSGDTHRCCDINAVDWWEIPARADLAWASFPCQDLSLAGAGAGLQGERSGTFWPFWRRMEALHADARAPRLICLENVCGTLTSHGGGDFMAICDAFGRLGYAFGAMVIDARRFLPQSRPRLFVLGVHPDLADIAPWTTAGPEAPWHTTQVVKAAEGLPSQVRRGWRWWRLPSASLTAPRFEEVVEDGLSPEVWHDSAQTERLLAMMSPLNQAKVESRCARRGRHVGTLYRRTRTTPEGGRVQRVEARFDGVAGCLRTPAGGSSRQTVILIEDGRVRTRLLTVREAARLMGLPDHYRLPENYNEAYHLVGDGVAAPVVAHLREHLFEPLLGSGAARVAEAA